MQQALGFTKLLLHHRSIRCSLTKSGMTVIHLFPDCFLTALGSLPMAVSVAMAVSVSVSIIVTVIVL